MAKLELGPSFWDNVLCIWWLLSLQYLPDPQLSVCVLKQTELLIHSQTSSTLGSTKESPEVKDHNDHAQCNF